MLNRFFLVVLVVLTGAVRGIEHRDTVDLNYHVERAPGDRYYRGRVSDDDMLDMYQKWVDTGLSSLMSAVAQSRLKRHRRSVITKYGECSAAATDVIKHAKCVSQLLKGQVGAAKAAPPKPRLSRLRKYKLKQGEAEAAFRTDPDAADEAAANRFRRSPKVQMADSYRINDNKHRLSPLGHVAKVLLDSIKSIKNRTDIPSWKDTVNKIRVNGAKRLKYKKLVEEDSEESVNQMSMGALRDNLLKSKPHGADLMADIDWESLAREPAKLKKFVEQRRKSKLQTQEEKLIDLIKQAMKLAYGLAGQNTTDFEHKNLKLVSPRFLGVTKEEKKEDEISLVSPSLFSLHSEGVGIENLTSIPNLLKGLGMDDQEMWLDIVMEAAGVNEESDKLEAQVQDFEYNKTASLMTNITRMVDEDGTPLYATKQNATDLGFDKDYIEMFERLQSNYSKDQMREMNSTGYSVLSRDQIEMLYGPASPMHQPDTYRRFANLNASAVHEQLHDDLHALAERESFTFRAKDIVLSPVLLSSAAILAPALASQPFILSPIVLTPLILSPAVFGAVVLSPWLFVPVVLAPRILGTLILSPFVLSPLILSPFALHPAVLSPGLFSPMILSPLLLLPLVLCPQAFTPIILNPLCLSPIILNPMLGSPLILSPFVLSPLIASPQILSALVLSPYALSPVIWSPLIAFVAILSPSWLS